jgi:hypothetical protein
MDVCAKLCGASGQAGLEEKRRKWTRMDVNVQSCADCGGLGRFEKTKPFGG